MLPISNDISTNFLRVFILGGDHCTRLVQNELRTSPSQDPGWKLLAVRKLGGDAAPGFAQLTGHPAVSLKFFAVRILGGHHCP